MANTKSAAKRARQSIKRMSQNRSVRSRLKTLQKRSRSAEGATTENIRALISALDKAAKRGIIHRNAANRRKARLNKLIGGAASRKK
jgi:small subunit ribosomal protein S20